MAGFNIGAITGRLVLDSSKWESAIKKSKKDMKSFEGSVLRSEQAIKKLGTRLTILGGVITATSGLLIKMSADVEESENLFEVSMGNMANATRRWSKQISSDLKLNEFEVRKTVGVFNVMTKSMGLSEQAAFQMSKEMTKLSFDMASFFNLRPDIAFQKISAAIAGESEPLKRLGIIVNETTTKQWALNNSLIAGNEQLSEAQKVIARYGVIMEATKEAQGDLARTLQSTTNRFRTFSSVAAKLGITLGQKLLPAVNSLLGMFISTVGVLQWLTDNFPTLTGVIVVMTSTFGALSLAIGPLLIALPGLAAAAAVMGTTITALLGTVLLPLVIVIAKLTLLVGALFLAFKKWDLLKAVFFNFSANLNSMLGKATSAIAKFVGKMAEVPLIGDKFKGLQENLVKVAKSFEENSDFMKVKVVESFEAQMQKDRERTEKILMNNEEINLSFKDMFSQVEQASSKSTKKLKGDSDDWLVQLKNDFKASEEAGRRTFNLLADSFSDIFFDAMTGEIKSFSELFADFGKSILRIMADIAAQWLAVKIITGIGSAVSGLAGGFGSLGNGLGGVAGAASGSTATTASGALSAGLDSTFGQLGQGFSNFQGLSLGSFADGLDRVPATGFYKLHKDEQVTPSRFTEDKSNSIELTIQNHITPEAVAATLSQRPAKDVVVNIIDQNALRNGVIRKRILDR